MSDPMSTIEIEDVLSSIRRLVSEELRPQNLARAAGADAAPRSEDAPEPAGQADDGGEAKLVLTPAQRVVSFRSSQSGAPHHEDADAGHADLPPGVAAPESGLDAAARRMSAGLTSASLEDTIAELEAAVARIDDEFEPDEGEPLDQAAEDLEPLAAAPAWHDAWRKDDAASSGADWPAPGGHAETGAGQGPLDVSPAPAANDPWSLPGAASATGSSGQDDGELADGAPLARDEGGWDWGVGTTDADEMLAGEPGDALDIAVAGEGPADLVEPDIDAPAADGLQPGPEAFPVFAHGSGRWPGRPDADQAHEAPSDTEPGSDSDILPGGGGVPAATSGAFHRRLHFGAADLPVSDLPAGPETPGGTDEPGTAAVQEGGHEGYGPVEAASGAAGTEPGAAEDRGDGPAVLADAAAASRGPRILRAVGPVQDEGDDGPEDAALPAATGFDAVDADEQALHDLVVAIIRKELQGPLGERITRNVRKLVRREINRVLESREFE